MKWCAFKDVHIENWYFVLKVYLLFNYQHIISLLDDIKF